jgi:hypothetical protein
MDQNTARFLGLVGVAAGLGGLAYVGVEYYRRKQASSLSLTVTPNAQPSGQVSSITVTITNPGSSAVQYGVQAAFVEPQSGGVVGGHFFTSAAVAQAAVAAAQAGNQAGLQQYVTTPSYRVAVVTVPAGGSASATLYSEPTSGSGLYTFDLWTAANPTGLLASDPTGQVPHWPATVSMRPGTIQIP